MAEGKNSAMRNYTWYLMLFVLVMCFVNLFSGCQPVSLNVEGSGLTEREIIINIATTRAKEEGVDLDLREVDYDQDNKAWAKKLEWLKEVAPEYVQGRNNFEILQDRDYQAVLFKLKPDPSVLGGELWVFVDRVTKEAITIHGEK